MTPAMAWHHVRSVAQAGLAVRTARRSAGLTQDQLADEAGVSRMTVSRLERGSAVGIDNFIAILAELDLHLVAAPAGADVRITAPGDSDA